jgi:hypothetical protein
LFGTADDIATPEKVLHAAKYLGTPTEHIVKKTVRLGYPDDVKNFVDNVQPTDTVRRPEASHPNSLGFPKFNGSGSFDLYSSASSWMMPSADPM